MALVRWNRGYTSPFGLLQSIHDDITRALEDSPAPSFSPSRWGLTTGAFVPPVDMFDQGASVVVRADLPGLKKEDIDVSVIRNTLTIRGEKAEEKVEGKSRSERLFGSFSRSLALPVPVDTEKVAATYRDGVLEIVLPKTKESKPRQVTVAT